MCCRIDRLGAFMLGGSPPRRAAERLMVMLIAFDALAIAGRDIRALAWRERRGHLEQLLAGANGALRITPVLAAVQSALVGHRTLARTGSLRASIH